LSSSDLVSMFLVIEFQDFIDPFFLCALTPIKSSSNAGADKAKILKENKNKSGIYLWTNLHKWLKVYRFFCKSRLAYTEKMKLF